MGRDKSLQGQSAPGPKDDRKTADVQRLETGYSMLVMSLNDSLLLLWCRLLAIWSRLALPFVQTHD